MTNNEAMDRRHFLRASFRGGLLVGSGAATLGRPGPRIDTIELVATGNSTVYLAEDGDDANVGDRPDRAWRTIARLNSAIRDGSVGAGHNVLLKRGDEFFGELDFRRAERLQSGRPLLVSAYGDGDLPKLCGYKVLNMPDQWFSIGGDVWKINLTDRASYAGNVGNRSANTGFLRVDGKIFGAKRWEVTSLKNKWDFYNDGTDLYVKLDMNPATAADDVRAAVDGTLIIGCKNLTVCSVDLQGIGGHAFRQRSAGPVEVSDCRIHEIGGARLSNYTRYGNGVELWMGSKDVSVKRNDLSEIYDVACTLQGNQKGLAQSIERCAFTSNRIWNCSQAFEFWGTGGNYSQGAGFLGCRFVGNICVSGGHSWSYGVRPDRIGKGNFVMAYRQDLPLDIDISRNLFFDARDCYQYVNTNGSRFKAGVECDRNVIVLRPRARIQAQLPFNIDRSDEWVRLTGHDRNSRWLSVPSSVVSSADALDYVANNLNALQPA